ncbi:MAG TPA: aa3-type cytochrome c oxidase subunit IV [Stellaceae bacterium]|nr:aa3-type cytochrome c oxidase subunit IV [Stellaceae bacterium]
MTMDQELQRHKDVWIGFTRLLKWAIAAIVVILLLMAFFLL